MFFWLNYLMYLIHKPNSVVNLGYFLIDYCKSEQTLATCVKRPFNHEINCVYRCCPVGMFFLAFCPYLVAVHGEPGGAAEHRTVKRGYLQI